MSDPMRIARAEAQALAAKLGLNEEKAITDYNIMMGNLEDPNEEDEEDE